MSGAPKTIGIPDDTLRETLLNVNRLVAKIEALKDNPVPSSVVMTKSTSTFPNLLLEETNTFDNSLPELETFCFNLEEPSSGSPTTHSDLSLPDYKAFYIDNDHFKEKSSGSTTTHVDFSQYDSFIFDLSNDQFPPADRSDFYHEEFADELAQIISQPEYDCFFKDEPELGNFTMDVVGNIFQTREPRVHVLNVLPTLELDFIPSSESIFAYVVWIFLPFLFIPVIPPYLLSCGDEDTIFDPGISKSDDDFNFHLFPQGSINPCDGSSIATLNKRFVGGTPCLSVLRIHENMSTTNVNAQLEDDQSSLFAYVVWIFLDFLMYPVVLSYLLSTGNEDTIFDPDISIYHSFMPDVSHQSGTFMKFNDVPDCEDSRFCPSLKIFTSSASIRESDIQI
ncbi:hypothetical protein Tco_1015315 [Tanacetum coccineum]|uniref:Uncharacterized protein n=1 Tax=Tanacetum coccineum TaxID=301880 RepID=A0ABQ5FKK0_9ASTR